MVQGTGDLGKLTLSKAVKGSEVFQSPQFSETLGCKSLLSCRVVQA